MSRKTQNKQHKRNRKYRKHKSHDSFDAINTAFNKVPRWKQKEITAKQRREKKRQKLIDSCKSFASNDNDEGGFDENAFNSLWDNDNNTNSNTNQNTNSNQPKQKAHRRKRKHKKRKLNDSSETLPKKRKLNELIYKDEDFEDKGIVIKTVHSKTINSKKIKEKNEQMAKKKSILSQIQRFEICQLMIDGIPYEWDEKRLNNYLLNVCSIECTDIHLFHNVKDKTKYGKAILIFESAAICGVGYKYLFDKSLDENKILFIKPISNKYTNYNLKQFGNGKVNKIKKKQKINNKCQVIKMSNLHWTTNENDIIKYFKPVGIPLKINIEIDQMGFTNGIAKVQFGHYKFVYNAINKLNNTFNTLKGRNVNLEPAVTKQLYEIEGKEFKNKTLQVAIFNISAQITESDLKEFIMTHCGEKCVPNRIHLIQHLEIFTTGYAFCKFDSFEETNMCVSKLNNKVLSDRPLRVIWSKPSKEYKLKSELRGKTNVLSFTNVRYNISEKDIREFVEGNLDGINVNKVVIFENAKGFRYGMCKVWVDECKYADMIVDELNGKLLKGKVVNINYWVENNNKNKNNKGGKNRRNKNNNNNKNRKNNRNNGKKEEKLGWDDDWFKKNVDKGGNDGNVNGKGNVKVPKRLVDLWNEY